MNHSNRNEFVDLVQVNQRNRNAAVLRAAVELFLREIPPSKEELLQFEELCLHLLPKIRLDERAEISARLSDSDAVPPLVAMALAKDDISVSSPILLKYKWFMENDLLALLANTGEAHARTLAKRSNLSPKVQAVISQCLAAQSEPQLPAHSMPIAKSNADIKPVEMTVSPPQKSEITVPDNPAMARLDMQEDLRSTAERLLAALRRKQKTPSSSRREMIMTPASLDDFLEMEHAHVLTFVHSITKNAATMELNPAHILKQAYRRADRVREFVKLARLRKTVKFTELLEIECGLAKGDGEKVTQDESGFALAICLKALALPVHVANEAFLLLNPALGCDAEQIYLLNWFYGQISPAVAHHLLCQWKPVEENDQTTSYQPVYAGEPHGKQADNKKQNARPSSVSGATASLPLLTYSGGAAPRHYG